MAVFMLIWELGGGLSHIGSLSTLAKALKVRGHDVTVWLRDPRKAAALDLCGIQYCQAPTAQARADQEHLDVISYAHILQAAGFDEPDLIAQMTQGWRGCFARVRPDVAVFDHSPIALFASRGLPVRRVLLGTGFYHPPVTCPMVNLRPWLSVDDQLLFDDEAALLRNANSVLASLQQPVLAQLAQIYEPVDASFVTSIQALDPFAGRRDADYVGIWPLQGGQSIHWPEGRPRVFGYLNPTPLLPALLKLLREREIPTVMYLPGFPQVLRERYQSRTLRISDAPLNAGQACAECDLAVHHAGLTMTALMLLAGKPMLLLPPSLDTRLIAAAARRCGAAVECPPDTPAELPNVFERWLTDESLRTASGRFAVAHRGAGEPRVDFVVRQLEELAR